MASWILRYDKLDDDQKEIVNLELDSNIWISGFAGSGKSVILVHRAIELLRKKPNAKIVLLVFTQSLVDMFKTGLTRLGHSEIEVKTIYDFMNGGSVYDYVFCDEVQDFTQSMIDEVKHRTRYNIYVAGDKFQSIYEKDVRYGERTIDTQVLSRTFETKTLKKIYRLTRSIINAVNSFLPSMKLATEGKPDATKVDVQIMLCKCAGKREEAQYVYNKTERQVRNNERTAVLFPNHKACIEFANFVLDINGKPQWNEVVNRYGKPDFAALNRHLSSNGIKLMYIGNGYGKLEAAEDKGIAVMMTYHSSKGLDFENVYLPFANHDMFITYDAERDKTIFMVAMSRSSKNLTITYSNRLYHHVVAFKDKCTEVLPDAPKTTTNQNDDPWGW